MVQNEAECTRSSCCHWNTEEEGDASFDGSGRCWSDIGTDICWDMTRKSGHITIRYKLIIILCVY